MKPLFTSLFLFTFAGLAINPVTIQLAWNPPAATVDAYRLYATNDISAPVGTWPLMITIPGNVTNASISMTPGLMYFYITSSNFWGESGPSNITNTPVIPTNVTSFKITR